MTRKIFLLITICGITLNSFAQQIQLKGVVSVQNSKTNTGQTQYVKNAEVEHVNDKNVKTKDVTGTDGKFTLNIKGVIPNTQTQIAVNLYGDYSDYMVVNEKEIKDITLGRITPVGIYICKKGELEKRQAEMVGINMRKLEERLEKDKKRLQKELDDLKRNNDYLNVRYRELKDSLNAIDDNIDKAFEKIREYAQIMTLENLDDRDENYVKAYNCFLKGELDSVSYYLNDDYLDNKYERVLQLQNEAKKEKALAAMLTESAKQKEELSVNSLNELLKEWLLLARTYDMKNDYEKAKNYYEKVINGDTTNAKNIFEFANYLHKIKEYTLAEKQYRQCLEIYWALEKENPKVYLPDVATTLNNLAVIHKTVNEYPKALKEYEEALEIRKKLADENAKTHLPDVATTLNNLANLHLDINEHPKASIEFEESLEIYRKLAVENPNAYLSYIATTLNNLANLHYIIKEYSKALEKYEEALKIRRKLATENPKVHLPDVAMILNNLGNLHYAINEYPKALKEYEEALEIRRKLAEENPKAYLPDVATTLNNLGTLHSRIKEYPKALTEFEETLEIRRKLVVENMKAYLPDMAMTLNNLAILHKTTNEHKKALKKFEEALEIYNKLAAENPKAYLHNEIRILNNLSDTYSQLKDYPAVIKYTNACNDLLLKYQKQINYKPALAQNYATLSWFYLFTKEYVQSEQSARQALELNSASLAKTNLAHALLFQKRFSEAEEIYRELSQTIYENDETYTQTLLEDIDTLEKEAVIPKERKGDVEKIRKMLKQTQNDKKQ